MKIFKLYKCMIVLNMGCKKLYIQLSFMYIYHNYILFRLLSMGEVNIELFFGGACGNGS